MDRDGAMIVQATFDNQSPWPCTPAGFGRTLERYDNGTDPDQPSSWFDGCMQGSPGVAYAPCDEQVIVNEINYHSADAHDAGDWIEIRNQYNTRSRFQDGPSGTMMTNMFYYSW
jgi:hypothetical protein